MEKAIYSGITAWVFSIILLDSDMIFGKLKPILEKFPKWIGKPLGLCEYCLAGQIGLWYYLIKFWNSYNIADHIFFISISIMTVELINKLIYK